MDGEQDLCRVVFSLDKGHWSGTASEGIWAAPVATDRFYLRSIPFYAYGVSFGDVLVARKGSAGELVFEGVDEKGGHSTYRLFLSNETDIAREEFLQYWTPLEQLGCRYEQGTDRLLAVDIPDYASIHETYANLVAGEEAGIWDFEEADVGHDIASGNAA